jgi:hypothetical protein
MLRLVLLALLPQIGGILLMVSRPAMPPPRVDPNNRDRSAERWRRLYAD